MCHFKGQTGEPDIDFENCSSLTIYFIWKFEITIKWIIIPHDDRLLFDIAVCFFEVWKSNCQVSSFTVKRIAMFKRIAFLFEAKDLSLSRTNCWQQNAVENKIRDKQQTSIAIMKIKPAVVTFNCIIPDDSCFRFHNLVFLFQLWLSLCYLFCCSTRSLVEMDFRW